MDDRKECYEGIHSSRWWRHVSASMAGKRRLPTRRTFTETVHGPIVLLLESSYTKRPITSLRYASRNLWELRVTVLEKGIRGKAGKFGTGRYGAAHDGRICKLDGPVIASSLLPCLNHSASATREE